MRFSILDIYLEPVAFVDKYISMLWQEEYNDQGAFLLELVENDTYAKNIRPDCFVFSSESETVMVITSVIIKDGIITASGKMATWIMKNMVFPNVIESDAGGIIAGGATDALPDRLSEILQAAYNNHPQKCYPEFDYSSVSNYDYSASLPENYTEPIERGEVFEIVQKICKFGDVGFKVLKKLQNGFPILYLSIYKPSENDIKITFSPEFGNMKDISVTWSVENYKNFAVSVLSDEEVQGIPKNTLQSVPWRDTLTDVSSYEDEAVAISAAKASLNDYQDIVNLRFTPIINKPLSVGDVVMTVVNKYNISLKQRIVKYSVQEQRNTRKVSIEVGVPIAKRTASRR